MQTLTPFFRPPFIRIPHRAARTCALPAVERSGAQMGLLLLENKMGQHFFTDLFLGRRLPACLRPHTSILHKTASTSSQEKKKRCHLCRAVYALPASFSFLSCSSINSEECCCLSYFMCHWLPHSLQNVACVWTQKDPLWLPGCPEPDGKTRDAGSGVCISLVQLRLSLLLRGGGNAAAVLTQKHP